MTKRQPLQIFSWGYYGWGSTTEHFVESVDAAERARGFRPPIFVDIRIKRAVRAPGFNGNAFERLLGEKRHRWMKQLGNKRIQTKKGPQIQIAEPESVNELLDVALEADEQNRRVIFFCGCMWARFDGKISCHRTTVGTLLLSAAKKRGVSAEVVEWPGGKADHVEIEVDGKDFKAIAEGRMSIPFGRQLKLAHAASLAVTSTATVRGDGEVLHRLVGPTSWHRDEWQLPVIWQFYDTATTLARYREKARVLRKSCGLEPRKV